MSSTSIASYLEQAAVLARETAVRLSDSAVQSAIAAIAMALTNNRPLMICGNGGSAADAEHITGELVGRFLVERHALNAICLSSNSAVITAWSNDYSYDTVFSRQVEAYAQTGAVLLGISTSGNSRNVLEAFQVAQHLGVTTIALTGEGGGKLGPFADILLEVPSKGTPQIQQLHMCIYHYICDAVERRLFQSGREGAPGAN